VGPRHLIQPHTSSQQEEGRELLWVIRHVIEEPLHVKPDRGNIYKDEVGRRVIQALERFSAKPSDGDIIPLLQTGF
jgi:hypothetical protein